MRATKKLHCVSQTWFRYVSSPTDRWHPFSHFGNGAKHSTGVRDICPQARRSLLKEQPQGMRGSEAYSAESDSKTAGPMAPSPQYPELHPNNTSRVEKRSREPLRRNCAPLSLENELWARTAPQKTPSSDASAPPCDPMKTFSTPSDITIGVIVKTWYNTVSCLRTISS